MTANGEQIELWQGRMGAKWAKHHHALDGMLKDLTEILVQQAGHVAGKRLLDRGCGTGETCNRWLDLGAEVTGLDVSPTLLAIANQVAGGRVTLVEADASVWRSQTLFDLIVSRFGVTFFEAPLAAFANIASNMKPGGRFVFCCWQAVSDNPWVTEPMAAIRDLLPNSLSSVEETKYSPGPFALADESYLRGLLPAAGLELIEMQTIEFDAVLSRCGRETAVAFAMEMGPTAAAIAGMDQQDRAKAETRLRRLFAQHEQSGVVSLPASSWMVTATCGKSAN